MKEFVHSSHPLPTRQFFYVTQHHTRSRISINFRALRSPHRRWPVGRALDSDHRGRGFESPRRFCLFLFLFCFDFFVFSFVFSLILDFIDSSAFRLFLFLIGLRFVNYILLEISKSGHYTRLYVAYIIKSCNPYPYHKAFLVAIVKIVLLIFSHYKVNSIPYFI